MGRKPVHLPNTLLPRRASIVTKTLPTVRRQPRYQPEAHEVGRLSGQPPETSSP
jgi:hypothetical protein